MTGVVRRTLADGTITGVGGVAIEVRTWKDGRPIDHTAVSAADRTYSYTWIPDESGAWVASIPEIPLIKGSKLISSTFDIQNGTAAFTWEGTIPEHIGGDLGGTLLVRLQRTGDYAGAGATIQIQFKAAGTSTWKSWAQLARRARAHSQRTSPRRTTAPGAPSTTAAPPTTSTSAE